LVAKLRRVLPAMATTAFLVLAPGATASTVTSGDPLTLQGASDVAQNWSFDDAAGGGTVDVTLTSDQVAYDSTNPLPANCQDYDSGVTDTSTPGADVTNDPDGDGTAYILRCTAVTHVIANAGDVGSVMHADDGLDSTTIQMTGGAGNDDLYGGKLDDTISGGPGYDYVAGYQGNDTVDGGADANDGVVGGPGNDTVTDGDGSTGWIAGGPGDDVINAGGGDDFIAGDCNGGCGSGVDGNDTIDAGSGNDYVVADGGDDTIHAGDDTDSVYGGDGNDTIDGGAGDDGYYNYFCALVTVRGCSGGLYGGNGDDVINGGDGSDWSYGGDGNDQINSGAGNDSSYGDAGNDTINAGDGNDYVDGGDGDDAIDGGAGGDGDPNDSLCAGGIGGCYGGLYGGSGDDTINGGDGNDIANGGDGNDHVNGGAGDDGDVNYDPGASTTAINLTIPGLSGGNGDDVVTGGPGDDVILNDNGADTLSGDAGSDYFVEGLFSTSDQSADTITGGDGVDSFQYWTCNSYSAGTDAFTASLDNTANDSRVDGDPATADDTGNNYDVENLTIADGLFILGACPTVTATLTGNDGANVLISGRGNDTIDPGKGPDRVEAGGGDDTINSRDGYPDYVSCGEGTDTVTGDDFDTYEGCENVDSVAMRSAYDLVDATPPAAPPLLIPVPEDKKPPKTTVTTDTSITSDQLLKGVTLTVGCDEQCTIEGRLLGSQPVGSQASTSARRGFNVVLGRKYMGLGSSKRKVTIKPCVRQSKKDAAACRARLQNQWDRKRSFTVKVQTTTRDKAGNRTRVTKLIKVTVKKHKKAGR
jgi:Ca2+-binding RTX toxin-like protein